MAKRSGSSDLKVALAVGEFICDLYVSDVEVANFLAEDLFIAKEKLYDASFMLNGLLCV